MPSSFTFPATILPRLALLATCGGDDGLLQHIHLRASLTACTFQATNGRILAIVKADTIDATGMVGAVLDGVQFTAACKLLAKGKRGAHHVLVDIGETEARISNGETVSLVELHAGNYPNVDFIIDRVEGGTHWSPSIASFDPDLLVIAKRFLGKDTKLLLKSAVGLGGTVERIWNSLVPSDCEATIPLSAMREAVNLPGYYTDHNLLLLIMPVSRSDAEDAVDASGFTIAKPDQALTKEAVIEMGVRLWMTVGVSEEELASAQLAIAKAEGQPCP